MLEGGILRRIVEFCWIVVGFCWNVEFRRIVKFCVDEFRRIVVGFRRIIDDFRRIVEFCVEDFRRNK